MTSSTGGDDNKVIEFPKTAEERRALRKARQDIERQRLVNLFTDEAGDGALFSTGDGVAFADLIVAGHRETWPIRSKQFRYEYIRYLKRQFEQMAGEGLIMALAMGLSLKKSAVNNAIDEFEIRAIGARTTREVHVRVAAETDAIYIDLADADWHAVRVTAMDWSIVQSPPVRFRRSAGMQPLPFPERGIGLDRLRPFLNVNANDFVLVVAYLLAALRPSGPYPILALIGEQGTAKTTFVRLLRSLIDPSTVPSSALPFSGRDLFIAAHNAHVQAFENVSKLPNPMSDYLCRLATGGGVRTRTLFKDVDETLLRATRPIMLEGIANYIVRADLQDRAIILGLEPLADRKTEAVLQAEFERLRPGLFGALLDHLVTGLRQLPDTRLSGLPRMADFATWAVACGLDGFEQAYAANRQAAIDVALEHDVLARAVRALMVENHAWQGTASELLDLLGELSQIRNAKVLSDELNRLAPMLRTIGVDIRHHRISARRGITITRQQ
jgi:hypothetical protein